MRLYELIFKSQPLQVNLYEIAFVLKLVVKHARVVNSLISICLG